MLRRGICNVTPKLLELSSRKLYKDPGHPLGILKNQIYSFFDTKYPSIFTVYEDFPPKVTTTQNFDYLLIPKDHVSRTPSDTYYFDETHLLRTHTSAHQIEALRKTNAFLITGDVYRRDEIDATHYPVFHQMEGVRIWNLNDLGVKDYHEAQQKSLQDLKDVLERLTWFIFGHGAEIRWIEAYFPFTHPSLELEVFYQGNWMEILGCGVVERGVLKNAGKDENTVGWAFGIGLERWAMRLFEIPDIRLFWSKDPRFLDQFSENKGITKFKPYSKYPLCYKDISFWIEPGFVENDFYEVVRDIGGDLIERVQKIDEFTNKQNKTSICYRINYRSMDRSLTNEEIDEVQIKIRQQLPNKLPVQLR
jgi:phenylalanyl-tRNA synthetase alpha chain